MDTNRLINIILSDLSLDNLKLQENLERAINDNEEVSKKVFKVKDILKSLVINDLMIAKFQSLVSTPNNNNNLNQNQNG